MDISFLLHFLSFGFVLGLYEDQIEKFDWRHQYFGKVDDFDLSEEPKLNNQLFVASSSHVLGSINLKNGSIVWRKALEENGRLIGFKVCGNYIITISYVPTILLRMWDAKAGYFLGEIPLTVTSSSSAIVCDVEADLFAVYMRDRIFILKLSTSPELLFEQTVGAELHGFDTIITQSSIRVDDLMQLHLLLSEGTSRTSFAYLKLDLSSSLNVSSSAVHPNIIEAPKGKVLTNCQLSINTETTTVICLESEALFFGNVNNKAKFEWNRNILKSKPTSLRLVTDNSLLVGFETNQNVLYSRNRTGLYNPAPGLPSILDAFAIKSSNPNSVLILERDSRKNFGNIRVQLYDLGSGSFLPSDFKHPLTLDVHSGQLEKSVYLNNYDSVLFFFEDHSIQLISKEGHHAWTREESLAHITAVEFIDLPVSSQQASMQDEFGNLNAGILQLFANRIRSQANQLGNAIMTFFASMSFSAPVNEGKDDTWLAENPRSTTYKPLTRDVYNLHKMIVVLTATGKLFGIESARGKIIWQFLVPEAALINDGNSAHLFQQRTTGHFPLRPIASVLLKSKKSGSSLLLFFDPISGVPINNELKQDVLRDCLIPLSKPVLQVTLLPGHISEKTSHIRPLFILFKDLDVSVFPELLAFRSDLLPSPFFLMYTADVNSANLAGYRVQQKRTTTESKLSSGSSMYFAHHAWQMTLSSADTPQKIVSLATRSANEHIYSIGRVLGDRNVLYKYVNPNLLAVLTQGSSRMENVDAVSLYLIDLAVGRIIHSAVHRHSNLPVSLLVVENWVLYSLYNQRSLRTEFTIAELFEPISGVKSLVPSPWELFSHSIFPIGWKNYFALQSCASQIEEDEQICRENLLKKVPNNRIFSSQHRAANSAFNLLNESKVSAKYSGLLIPDILQRSYILSSPLRPGCVAATSTERGITAKSLLIGLDCGYILELSKSLLDPRRTLDVTPELVEEGLEPYSPELPLSTMSVLTYYKSIERIRRIHTTPSGLESTGLVFAHGLDIFFTRIAPSKTYDLLRDDFDHWFIAMITVGMIIVSVVASRLAARKEMRRAWR